MAAAGVGSNFVFIVKFNEKILRTANAGTAPSTAWSAFVLWRCSWRCTLRRPRFSRSCRECERCKSIHAKPPKSSALGIESPCLWFAGPVSLVLRCRYPTVLHTKKEGREGRQGAALPSLPTHPQNPPVAPPPHPPEQPACTAPALIQDSQSLTSKNASTHMVGDGTVSGAYFQPQSTHWAGVQAWSCEPLPCGRTEYNNMVANVQTAGGSSKPARTRPSAHATRISGKPIPLPAPLLTPARSCPTSCLQTWAVIPRWLPQALVSKG